MGHRERVGENGGLEPGRADVTEEPWTGLGQALVEDELGGVERGADPESRLGQRGLQQPERSVRHRWLTGAGRVEGPPCLAQQGQAVVQGRGAFVTQRSEVMPRQRW